MTLEQAFFNHDIINFKCKLDEHLKTFNINDEFKNSTHYKDSTLLTIAIIFNNFEIVNLLVTEYGADVNKSSPLLKACSKGNFKIVKFLCDNGAELHPKLIEELVSQEKTFEIIDYLFKKYPEIDFEKNTILSQIIDSKLLPYLLEKGAIINLDNCSDILIRLSNNKNTTKSDFQLVINSIKKLNGNVKYYMNLHDSENENNTILQNVTDCDDVVNIVKLLIKNGADINTPTYFGSSVLYLACANNNVPLVKLLINNGANIRELRWNVLSSNWCRYSCAREEQFKILKCLIKHDPGAFTKELITHICENASIKSIDQLLSL